MTSYSTFLWARVGFGLGVRSFGRLLLGKNPGIRSRDGGQRRPWRRSCPFRKPWRRRLGLSLWWPWSGPKNPKKMAKPPMKLRLPIRIIIGPSYNEGFGFVFRRVFFFLDLQTTSIEIPCFLGLWKMTVLLGPFANFEGRNFQRGQ